MPPTDEVYSRIGALEARQTALDREMRDLKQATQRLFQGQEAQNVVLAEIRRDVRVLGPLEAEVRSMSARCTRRHPGGTDALERKPETVGQWFGRAASKAGEAFVVALILTLLYLAANHLGAIT